MAIATVKRNRILLLTPSEVQEFTWTIDNVRDKIGVPTWTEIEDYIFDAGDTIQFPTKWRLRLLNTSTANNEFGILLRLINRPNNVSNVRASFGFKTLTSEKEFQSPNEYTDQRPDFGWYDALTLTRDLSQNHLQNGNLAIKIKFTLFSDKFEDTENAEYKRMKFTQQSMEAVTVDLQKLLDSGDNSDLTIQTKDGKEIKAHRAILATRSPVFFAMFQHQMTESSTGVVQIDDMNFEGMKSTLNFIYSGTLCPKWEDSAEEIAYAANKYQLPLLLQYCDYNMASVCNVDNAWDLIDFAHLHGLETAEKEIADYIEKNLREILQAKLAALDQQD